MPRLDPYGMPPELVLGARIAGRVPAADQVRQRGEVVEILHRLRKQPGVVLADEVGMGKTFVALGVAYAVAARSSRGPAIVMVPANLVDKWEQDLKTFCELYLDGRRAGLRGDAAPNEGSPGSDLDVVRYDVARHSIDLMKLLDDPPRDRCHLIFLAQGAMGRQQTDKWVRLALIGETLRRHGRGRGKRLIQVKTQIHRFVAELVWALGEQHASDWGDELWQSLLRTDPSCWRDTYNQSLRPGRRPLDDHPVPKNVARAVHRVNLRPLADALEHMPVRAGGDASRLSERIDVARRTLRAVERELWTELLATARWRSPLLVMDEAHHLKNPGTSLARQLQSHDVTADLRTGDGAMARAFDRMLFLTATPFQLGHHELVQVLERFGDVRWDDASLGERQAFFDAMKALGNSLTESQRTAVALQQCWAKLRPEDGPAQDGDRDGWWASLQARRPDDVTPRLRALLESFDRAAQLRGEAQRRLRPWVIRHNKPERWGGTDVARRRRIDGAAISDGVASRGLDVPAGQLLPFFLAARSAAAPGKDLLGEALCSSYEAFRFTRRTRRLERDDADTDDGGDIGADDVSGATDLTSSAWYLREFDAALTQCSGGIHPKMMATVRRVVDLWEHGEKVLVFAFYRRTCRALRIHISDEIERRTTTLAMRRLNEAARDVTEADVARTLENVQRRYFDRAEAPGRVALDAAVADLVDQRREDLAKHGVDDAQRSQLLDVMRRFMRVSTTLVRCFPIHAHDTLAPADAVREMLATEDASSVSWRRKFEAFLDFLLTCCSASERDAYLEAALRTQTGDIRVEADDEDAEEVHGAMAAGAKAGVTTLANIQVATGATRRETRSRLMRAFNTPFFPDILVCSQVMGEGVDLQRCCRHVIHHDLAWNPSTIEQRTGRIDRLGCKAEGRNPIHVYLPYIAGTADQRQYRVMCDRESWFRIVMGQDEVAKLIPADGERGLPPLPSAVESTLAFRLGLAGDNVPGCQYP